MITLRDDFVPHEIVLAEGLFNTVSALTQSATDGIYADCLLALAFTNLLSALRALSDEQLKTEAMRAHLKIVARSIADCAWLSEAVRVHLSKTLHALRDDLIAPELVMQIITAGANRAMHAQVIDCMRAIGSDGLGELAAALQAVAAPVSVEAH